MSRSQERVYLVTYSSAEGIVWVYCESKDDESAGSTMARHILRKAEMPNR
jgi:hypothetical protein